MKVTESPALFVGVLGLGFLQVVGLYESAAPKLKDTRGAPPGDISVRQQLLDADILIGGTTLIVAIAASVVMKSTWPIVFLFGGFVLVSSWHHMVLNSPER